MVKVGWNSTMRSMNSTKKCNKAINNSKNKLNSKISWLFKLEASAHIKK